MSLGRVVLSKEKNQMAQLQKRWRFLISECRTMKFFGIRNFGLRIFFRNL